LNVLGTVTLGGTATISNASTLSGTGTIVGAVDVQNTATLAPGTSGTSGTLSTGALTLENGSAFALTLDTNGLSGVTSSSSINLGLSSGDLVSLTISLGALPAQNSVFDILSGSSVTNTGRFSYQGTSLSDGDQFTVDSNGNVELFQINYGTTADTLTALSVPEPETWALMMGGMGLLAFGQRFRRRK